MSSVAGAVVTIDGDSSGLVGALQKGEKALGGVKNEARKLTDQLRDVADDADKAAGALVNKIGGPNAIKAIAGIGGAFVVAEAALGAFSASMDAFASTQGAAGQQAMADLDTALNKLKGELFTAVMGTDDMQEAMSTLMGAIDLLKGAFHLILTPVSEFAKAIRDLSVDHSSAATDARENAKAEKEYQTATNDAAAAVKGAHEQYQSLKRGLIELLGTKKELAIFDLEERKGEYANLIAKQETVLNAKRAAAADLAAKQAESTTREKLFKQAVEEDIAWQKKAYSDPRAVLARGTEEQTRYRAEVHAREVVETNGHYLELIDQAGNAARAMAAQSITIKEAGLSEEREKTLAGIAKLDAEIARLRGGPDNPITPTTGGGGPPKAAEDAMLKVTELADGTIKILTDAEAAALEASVAAAGSNMTAVIEIKQSEYDKLAELKDNHDAVMLAKYTESENAKLAAQADYEKKSQAGTDAFQAAFNEARAADIAAEEEAQKKKAAAVLAAKQVVFNLTVTQNAKMLAAAIVAEKSASEIARAALGNVASGLGDIAMIKSGEYAADGLFPQATGMAVVGTTAYTIAGLLGADKKANAGPPTERAQPVQNYAYNLRIDSAFADSESISRRFAQMQEGARQRGLITAAA